MHTIHRCHVVLFMLGALLLAMAQPGRTKTVAQWLDAASAPNFKAGNTLPRLTQCGWDLDYDTCVALADHWGYCLIFQWFTKDLAKPDSLSSRLVALSAADPKRYPLSVYVLRPFQEANFLATLPESAWTHQPDGTRVKGLISPLAPDSAYEAAAKIVGSDLALIQRKTPINIILNAGEEGLTVAGNSGGHWRKDPAILQALGDNVTKDAAWDNLISTAKAHGELIIKNAALAAAPTASLYEYYTTDGDMSRGEAGMSPPGVPDNQWIWHWEYPAMRPVSTLPNTQMYYKLVNSGWAGRYPALTQYLNAVAQQIACGDPLSYNWVNAGSSKPPSPNNSDDAHYIGILKCMYTAGMVGGIAGYFRYPEKGFTGEQGEEAPLWLLQMEDLGQVHALFTYLENYLRNGDLLPGPDHHFWSKDLPAYEFPTGDDTAHVLVRRLRGQQYWLICAWAADGADRNVSVTIPDLGKVTVQARAAGSVYRATPGPKLILLDTDALHPTAAPQNLLAIGGQ